VHYKYITGNKFNFRLPVQLKLSLCGYFHFHFYFYLVGIDFFGFKGGISSGNFIYPDIFMFDIRRIYYSSCNVTIEQFNSI